MFSILNEINNNSHFRTTGVVTASIGLAAFIYILVAITGYLSFGNSVVGNIIGICKFPLFLFFGPIHKNTHPHQTRPQYPLQLAKPQSSSSSCSPIHYRSILVARLLMQSSDGDLAGGLTHPMTHLVVPHPLSHQISQVTGLRTALAIRGSLLSRPSLLF